MNKFVITMGLLILIADGAAFAQSGTGTTTTTGASSAQKTSPLLEAPVGHRQPRPSDVPSEKNLSNPNDPANKEDADLDRKIKSICRGC
jgi:hypothetical protein